MFEGTGSFDKEWRDEEEGGEFDEEEDEYELEENEVEGGGAKAGVED